MTWKRILGATLVLGLAAVVLSSAAASVLNAHRRGQQKRTMGDLRTLATAIESYGIDARHYPRVESIWELAEFLEPTYIESLPLVDGWGEPFEYWSFAPDEYIVRSSGGDKTFQYYDPRAYPGGTLDDFRRSPP